MKKISFACILVLVFAVGIAHAQQYKVAPADHKDFITEEYLVPGQDFCFDIYLTGVSLPQTAGGVYIDFADSIEVLSYVSSGRAFFDGSEGVYGPWDPSFGIDPPLLPSGYILMAVANLAGAVPDGDGDLIVGRVCLQCEGLGDGFVNITTIPGVATWTPVDDTTINANTTQPVLTIHQVCDCTTDAHCDDGNFCNGAETCDAPNCMCEPGTNPCPTDTTCNEDTDTCDPIPATGIPTLSEWGIIIFMTIILGIGVVTLVRRRT